MTKRLASYLAAATIALSASTGARAQGIPVIDIANLIQTIQQLINDITKIENQVQQITELQNQLASINGIKPPHGPVPATRRPTKPCRPTAPGRSTTP